MIIICIDIDCAMTLFSLYENHLFLKHMNRVMKTCSPSAFEFLEKITSIKKYVEKSQNERVWDEQSKNKKSLRKFKKYDCDSSIFRGGSKTAVTSKMARFVIIVNAFVNYYHKALHLGCCNSLRSASDLANIELKSQKQPPQVF